MHDLPSKIIVDALANVDALGGRIYPLTAPQNTVYPCAVYELDGSSGTETLQGSEEVFTSIRLQIQSKMFSEATEVSYESKMALLQTPRIASALQIGGDYNQELATYELDHIITLTKA